MGLRQRDIKVVFTKQLHYCYTIWYLRDFDATTVSHFRLTYQWPLCNASHQAEVQEPGTKKSQLLDPNLLVALEEN